MKYTIKQLIYKYLKDSTVVCNSQHWFVKSKLGLTHLIFFYHKRIVNHIQKAFVFIKAFDSSYNLIICYLRKYNMYETIR